MIASTSRRHRTRWLSLLVASSVLSVLLIPGASWAAADPPQWSSPSHVADTSSLATPQIASLPDGSLIAVWTKYIKFENWIIESSRSTDLGHTWSTPVRISLPDGYSYSPKVAVAADGSMVVAWAVTNVIASEYQVHVARSTDGQLWTNPVTLEIVSDFLHQPFPEIAASPDGSVHVLWRNVAFVRASQSTDNGLTWGAPAQTVSSNARGDQSTPPQIAAAADGSVAAVWESGTDPFGIQASRLVSGVWTTPSTLSTLDHTSEINAQNPQLSAGADGAIAAVWVGSDGPSHWVQTSTLTAGAWSSTDTLSHTATPVYTPEIAVESSIRMTAVWSALDQIHSRSFDGSAWDTPAILSGIGGTATVPQVAFSPNGRLTVIWKFLTGPPYVAGVQSSYSDDGATWSPPADLSTPAPNQHAQSPQIATLPNSDIAVIWEYPTPGVVQSTFTMTEPTITSGAPTGATVGQPYSFQVTASGNPPPTFAVSAGSLPAGLAMSPAGLITGSPTSASSETFTITASNGANPDASASYTLAPLLEPTITSAAPPAATVGQSYSFQVTADGSPAPTYSITNGTLPPGLAMTTGGLISGTPTAAGDATFTITADNGVGSDDSASYTLAVAPAAISPVPPTPPAPGPDPDPSPGAIPGPGTASPGTGPGSGAGSSGSSAPTGDAAALSVTGSDPLPLVIGGIIALGIGAVLFTIKAVSPRRNRWKADENATEQDPPQSTR